MFMYPGNLELDDISSDHANGRSLTAVTVLESVRQLFVQVVAPLVQELVAYDVRVAAFLESCDYDFLSSHGKMHT